MRITHVHKIKSALDENVFDRKLHLCFVRLQHILKVINHLCFSTLHSCTVTKYLYQPSLLSQINLLKIPLSECSNMHGFTKLNYNIFICLWSVLFPPSCVYFPSVADIKMFSGMLGLNKLCLTQYLIQIALGKLQQHNHKSYSFF